MNFKNIIRINKLKKKNENTDPIKIHKSIDPKHRAI